MPRTDIDYSNTVFYKIYCKDINFHDVYIGHTTNFVQRKHAHKRACNKSTDQSHNLKVYKIIREHGGWDNWNMEMIGFKNCKDHSEACTVEQEYFDSYQASLNSILAKKSIIERLPIAKEKLDLYCEVCKIKCSCTKSFERHNKTKKHESLVKAQNNDETTKSKYKSEMKFNSEICDPKNANSFHCEVCNFKCSKQSNYNTHILTAKHKNRINRTETMPKNAETNTSNDSIQYVCECGKTYSARNSLWYHKKKCTYKEDQNHNKDTTASDGNILNALIRQQEIHKEESAELKKMLIQQQEQMKEQQEQHNKQILDLIPQLQQVANINNNNFNNKEVYVK